MLAPRVHVFIKIIVRMVSGVSEVTEVDASIVDDSLLGKS